MRFIYWVNSTFDQHFLMTWSLTILPKIVVFLLFRVGVGHLVGLDILCQLFATSLVMYWVHQPNFVVLATGLIFIWLKTYLVSLQVHIISISQQHFYNPWLRINIAQMK